MRPGGLGRGRAGLHRPRRPSPARKRPWQPAEPSDAPLRVYSNPVRAAGRGGRRTGPGWGPDDRTAGRQGGRERARSRSHLLLGGRQPRRGPRRPHLGRPRQQLGGRAGPGAAPALGLGVHRVERGPVGRRGRPRAPAAAPREGRPPHEVGTASPKQPKVCCHLTSSTGVTGSPKEVGSRERDFPPRYSPPRYYYPPAVTPYTEQ